mmetsp:Transcript_16996/g.55372  ORF Transcript_16996/g.55372 Transcript_16996/m.55372 type:complete len:207 (+) Transcript_16996:1880-2500(+)
MWPAPPHTPSGLGCRGWGARRRCGPSALGMRRARGWRTSCGCPSAPGLWARLRTTCPPTAASAIRTRGCPPCCSRPSRRRGPAGMSSFETFGTRSSAAAPCTRAGLGQAKCPLESSLWRWRVPARCRPTARRDRLPRRRPGSSPYTPASTSGGARPRRSAPKSGGGARRCARLQAARPRVSMRGLTLSQGSGQCPSLSLNTSTPKG